MENKEDQIVEDGNNLQDELETTQNSEEIENGETEPETNELVTDEVLQEKITKNFNQNYKPKLSKFLGLMEKRFALIVILTIVIAIFYCANYVFKDSLSNYLTWLNSGSPRVSRSDDYLDYNYDYDYEYPVDTIDVGNVDTAYDVKKLEYDTEISYDDVETWYDEPIDVLDDNIFTLAGQNYEIKSTLIVGERGDNKILLVETIYIGMPSANNSSRIYEQKANGDITYVCKPIYSSEYYSSVSFSTCESNTMFSNVNKFNSSVKYSSLGVMSSISLEDLGADLEYSSPDGVGGSYESFISNNDNEILFLSDVSTGKLYMEKSRSIDTGLENIAFFVKTPINTVLRLDYNTLPNVFGGYNWSVGSPNTSGKFIQNMGFNCSLNSYYGVTRYNFSDSEVQLAGLSSNNKKVYEIKNLENSILLAAYSEYVDLYTDVNDYRIVSL